MSNIVIVGAGIAGLSAAITASNHNASVFLISPDYSERSQSVMAMGGINAAINTKGENDSIDEHYADTIRGGCDINNKKAVLKLTKDAPEIINWLDKIGTSFTRDENGNVDVRYFGGQKKKRTVYAGARTGKQIVSALISECRKKEAEGSVKRFVGWRFLSLIWSDEKECCGVVCINENTQEIKSFIGDAVIIATGGFNKLFGKTSGSIQNDGYTTARLLIEGVELANLEMIQFHPTTVKTSSKRMLITEAARGEGGKLYVIKDGKPWYFMKEWYPEMAELMPRDVVSRSIYKASEGGNKEVYLDLTHLSEETIKVKLDEVYEICTEYLNLNPIYDPIPIYPGVHYFMGGIKTDENHKTNVKGLYAAGECSCQYHGANRLGGNSLLGAVHGGIISAKNAVLENPQGKLIEIEPKMDECVLGDVSLNEIEEELSNIMNNSMGIYRNEEDLVNALYKLDNLNININAKYYDYIKIKSLIILAKACILSAIERKESRGSHQRVEYPQINRNYEKDTCVNYMDDINISFK